MWRSLDWPENIIHGIIIGSLLVYFSMRICSLAIYQFIHLANTFALHLLVPGTILADGNKLIYKTEIKNLLKAIGPKFLDFPPLKISEFSRCQLHATLCYFTSSQSILISLSLTNEGTERLVRKSKSFRKERTTRAHIWTHISWL